MDVSAEQTTNDILGRPICLCGARMDLTRMEPLIQFFGKPNFGLMNAPTAAIA